MKRDRLQKIISSYGYCSRRQAEKLILNGKVKVNDKLITELGIKISYDDVIKINEQIINKKNKKIYLLFNKPRCVLTTTNDPKNRKIVMEFFSEIKERIYPVGRLDYDTSGALLFTNDGTFANLIMHPRYEIDKKYLVTIKGKLSEEKQNQLENGIQLEKNFITSKSKVLRNEYDKVRNKSYIELVIHEGVYHQVKRMFKFVSCEVAKLKRTEIGIIKLGDLKPGKYRELSNTEINYIKNKFT